MIYSTTSKTMLISEELLHEKITLAADATIRQLRDEYDSREPDIHHWDWMPGVGLYGLLRAYDVLGEQKYLDYCQSYIDRLLDCDMVSYSVNGAILFEVVLKLYTYTGETRYKDEMHYFIRWLLRSAAKCQNGCYEHTWTNVDVNLAEQVWIDTLFMVGIVLADSYRVFGREDCRSEAVRQFKLHAECLQDSETALYYHIYDVSADSTMAGAFWGRGNGWMAASAVDVLEAMGAGSADTQPIIAPFSRQMDAVKKLQEPDGLFRTVLNDKNTYPEMSAAAALGYGALKGVRLGILGDEFMIVGEKAVQAALNNILPDGVVNQVSSGTSGFIRYEEYNRIPIAPRLYGQGLTIMLLAEYLRYVVGAGR
jgi:unsaturated rhamnogalacturonyl hydrolase